jgi:methanogenic corrinoid protein MtbC1
MVAAEFVPLFLMTRDAESQPLETHLRPAIGSGEVERVAELAVSLEAHRLLEVAESFLERGVPVESLFVDLLAPAARHLGRRWEDDRLDFVDVTMGLWRLQEVLRDIAARAPRFDSGLMRGAALFSPMPGDQHSFGAAMMHECFALAGWDAEMQGETTDGELLNLVGGRAFDLLGLTLSLDAHIERAPALIRAVRSVSMNPRICIMIGGSVCNADPTIAMLAGADGTAADAPGAVAAAERLVRAARAIAA